MAANYNQAAFFASTLSTHALAATGTSTSVQFQSGNNFRHCRIANAGTTIAFVEFGSTSTVAAVVPAGTTLGSIPIPPGGVGVQIVAAPYPWIAAICSGTTATTLYITAVEGGLS